MKLERDQKVAVACVTVWRKKRDRERKKKEEEKIEKRLWPEEQCQLDTVGHEPITRVIHPNVDTWTLHLLLPQVPIPIRCQLEWQPSLAGTTVSSASAPHIFDNSTLLTFLFLPFLPFHSTSLSLPHPAPIKKNFFFLILIHDVLLYILVSRASHRPKSQLT